jgi:hypothetical protein
VIANSDGSGERTVVRRKRFIAPSVPAWSPDGKRILDSVTSMEGGFHTSLVETDLATGEQRKIGVFRPRVVISMAVVPDGSAVLLAAIAGSDLPQLWLQPYPDGEAVRLTSDVSGYHGVRFTSDGKTISSVRVDPRSQLMVANGLDENSVRRFSAGANHNPLRIDAGASGAVVYDIAHENGFDVAIVEREGAAPRMLTDNAVSVTPSITDDGSRIAFASLGGGPPHVFLMNADGSDVRQLTNGAGERLPEIAPDGSFVCYLTTDNTLWKLPLAGGEPQKLAASIESFDVHPDSKRIVARELRQIGAETVARVVVLPAAGGATLHDLPLEMGQNIAWNARGDGITMVQPGAGNLIELRFDGASKLLTRFSKGDITSHCWTRDGRLLMARGETRSNVVLITNFR